VYRRVGQAVWLRGLSLNAGVFYRS